MMENKLSEEELARIASPAAMAAVSEDVRGVSIEEEDSSLEEVAAQLYELEAERLRTMGTYAGSDEEVKIRKHIQGEWASGTAQERKMANYI